MRLLLCALVVAFLAGAAFAYPSLLGPTGLVALPTADSLGLAKVDIAADFASADQLDLVPLRATVGVGRGELWGMTADVSDGGGSITGFGGKLPVYQVPLVGMQVAVGLGIYDLSDGDGDLTNIYLVASQDLPHARGHVGLMSIDASLPGANATETRPFVGFELYTSDGMTLAVEIRAKADSLESEAPKSVVLRKSLTKGLAVEGGFTNGAFLGLGAHDTDFFVGLKYRVGAL
jgi:hypothetical protein